MTPYDGMTFDIPYGKSNANTILSAQDLYSFAMQGIGISRIPVSWNANKASGIITTAGYWRGTAITIDTPTVTRIATPGMYSFIFTSINRDTYYNWFWYFNIGSTDSSVTSLAGHYHNAVTNSVANYADLIAYRDDSYVYMWNNAASASGAANSTYLSYINNVCKLPLNVFYVDTTPDVPEPKSVSYIVRGRWKKGVPDDPGSGGGYSDEQTTPSQPGDTNPPEGDSYGVGGGGNFDDSTDTIAVDDLPGVSALGSGLITLYAPTIQNLNEFSRYLWSDLLSVETIKRAISDPMQAIISLHAIPGATYGPSTITGSPENVYFAGIDSGVRMNKFLTQYIEFDCGTLNFVEYYGSALDYNPYTKISLYLPYIGDIPLDADEIMRTTVGVLYKIDILTGNCVALITVDGSVHYQFAGNCASHFPISSANYSRTISAALGVVGAGLTFAGLGAAGAGLLASSIAGSKMSSAMSNVSKGVKGVSGPLIKQANMLNSFAMGANSVDNALQDAASIAYGAAGSSGLSAVMGGKLNTYHASALTGNTGLLGQGTPYFTIIRPRQSLARDYNTVMGYPTNVRYRIGELSGFIKITGARLENIPGTAEEIGEIYSYLKSGVII